MFDTCKSRTYTVYYIWHYDFHVFTVNNSRFDLIAYQGIYQKKEEQTRGWGKFFIQVKKLIKKEAQLLTGLLFL